MEQKWAEWGNYILKEIERLHSNNVTLTNAYNKLNITVTVIKLMTALWWAIVVGIVVDFFTK